MGSLKETTARVYSEVIQTVKSELNVGRGEPLDPGDASEVAQKVEDTIESTIEYLRLGHKVDMLTMFSITHTVINRSQEEKMDHGHGKQLLGWQQGWTWGHHAHLMEMKNALKGQYSVWSPVDLMRMLGNADRHLNGLFKGTTPLRALLDEFPQIHCLTASLIPFLDSDQIGVDEEQRTLAKKHLENNPRWKEFFQQR
jgi:hypothetical protein